ERQCEDRYATSVPSVPRHLRERWYQTLTLPYRHFRFRVDNVLGNAIHEVLKRMGSLGAEVASPVPVRVEVGDRVLLQLSGVGLRPLRGAKQGWFFSIPEAIEDRTVGLPSL